MPTSIFYTFDGKTMTLREWSRETGIRADTLRERIVQRHWPLERAFTQPLNAGKLPRRPRPLVLKNLAIIARITKATARARLQHQPQRPDQTGGRSPTFNTVQRTGAVRHETYFEGTSA